MAVSLRMRAAANPLKGARGLRLARAQAAPRLSSTPLVHARFASFATPLRAANLAATLRAPARPTAARAFSSYPDHVVHVLPALSPSMEGGAIQEWLVKEGDAVGEGEVFCKVETDKAAVDWECQEEGFVAKILVGEGEDLPLGTPCFVFVEEEDDIAAFANYVAKAAPAAAPPAAAQAPVAAPAPVVAAPAAAPAHDGKWQEVGGRVFASPLARKVAREKGYDVNAIPGTGPSGRVIEADVLAYTPAVAAVAAPAAAAPVQIAAGASLEFTDMTTTKMRKVIASRLLESKTTIPHYYLSIDCEMDALMAVRAKMNALGDGEYKLSVNDFVIKASALALRDVPEVNASWMGDFIRQYHTVDINIAVSSDAGLVTPLIGGVDGLGLEGINAEVKELATKGRDGKLQPQEMAPGGFTISNLGMFGIKNFCAIINPPQAAILAVGCTEQKVVLGGDGDLATVGVMNVTLSCDHRVIDGAVGAQWLNAFKKYMENPMAMLL